MRAFVDAPARIAAIAAIVVLFRAVQGLREHPRHGLLAAAAGTGKQVSVGEASALQAAVQLPGHGPLFLKIAKGHSSPNPKSVSRSLRSTGCHRLPSHGPPRA